MIDVWNFYDPEKVSSDNQLFRSSCSRSHFLKLLSGAWFRGHMVKLIEPFLDEPQPASGL
jgi:hypothetical protein